MFTGIVEERGRVRRVEAAGSGTRLEVECHTVLEDAAVGDSIAVSGVCLTVVERGEGWLGFDVSGETLARTTVGQLAAGDPVNLERPLTLATRLGGHLVQGHVDGVGEVTAVERRAEEARMTVRPPDGLGRYLVEKGSVAVDGVSLTVARTDGATFEVALVPHTLQVTTLGETEPGRRVNLEMDVLAKYVEGMARRDR